ncbi:histidinol-phosphate transaminase [Advenella sp. S44]|uniref:histidinol-phosphate transaminase n=1 Tax=Advenella sp. S44 TaxID=1982755 RepID=UPI000C29B4A9|nr:histidinol-phosphate transaminase [Advenella sp. S44]PJX23366.1 histidinol-phosphate transaminase [Advenella sp. S44]
MSAYWSDFVKTLDPYVPGEQPTQTDLIKLNTNESPFAPSPAVLEAIRQATADQLRLYPSPESDRLRTAVGKYYDLPADHVFPGNGSDEVLAHLFLSLFRHQGKQILLPDISYSFYPVYCRLYDIDYQSVPLADDFSIRIQDYLALPAESISAVIFPNPNAPTGIALTRAEIEQLLIQRPQWVVAVDEAYVDFGAESCVPLIRKYKNLVVLQTLSKSRSLAGLRVGFALGQPELLEGLVRVKNSFNSYPIDRLAEAGAIAAFEDQAYFEHTIGQVVDTREYLIEALKKLGFEVLPSRANFVFVSHPQHDAGQLLAALRAHAILVRHFSHPRIASFLRVTIGTKKQCETLIKSLSEILS